MSSLSLLINARPACRRAGVPAGLFKYCDKQGKKIAMHDDTKPARELRQEQMEAGTLKDDAFTQFWLEVRAVQ